VLLEVEVRGPVVEVDLVDDEVPDELEEVAEEPGELVELLEDVLVGLAEVEEVEVALAEVEEVEVTLAEVEADDVREPLEEELLEPELDELVEVLLLVQGELEDPP